MTFEEEMREFWASLENLSDLEYEELPKPKKKRRGRKVVKKKEWWD